MYLPIIIANYFIRKFLQTGKGDLTPMKLLKLVYISHGWYLAITKRDLINEPVQAWQYGPVVPSVYQHTKVWGRSLIKQPIGSNTDNTNSLIEEDDKQILDKVWDVYLNFSGMQLSTLTHQPGSPWDSVYNSASGIRIQRDIIPNTVIKDYYEQKLNNNR